MPNMYQLIECQDDFIVVDKTPGVSFHAEGGEAGLFEMIKQGEGLEELYPVHRLDKMTSGLLLLATNKAAAAALGEQFSSRRVSKYYLAISDRKPGKKQGLIRGDMVSARRGSYKLLKSTENPAITQFFSHSIGGGRRLYLLKPHSGKTHQLRVALKSIGAPIVGDRRYYPECPPTDRGYLHAYVLGFALQGVEYRYRQLPVSGEHFQQVAVAELLDSLWREPECLPWPAVPGR